MPVSIRRQQPSRKAVVRAVASSTAIETGQRIADIEARLLKPRCVSSPVTLAIKPARRPTRG